MIFMSGTQFDVVRHNFQAFALVRSIPLRFPVNITRNFPYAIMPSCYYFNKLTITHAKEMILNFATFNEHATDK